MAPSPDEKTKLLVDDDVEAAKSGYSETRYSGGELDGKVEFRSPKEKAKKKDKIKRVGFRKLFRYATATDVFLIIVGSLAAGIHGAGWPILAIVFGDMTNTLLIEGNAISASDGNGGGGNGTGFRNISTTAATAGTGTAMATEAAPAMSLNEFESQMSQYALRYIYIGLAMFVSSYVQIACWTTACERQVHKLREQFFHQVLRQEIGWFDRQQTGDLTTKLNDDLERVRDGMGDKFSLMLQFYIACLAGFVVGFVYGWKLTLVMMSLTPLLALSAAWMGVILAGRSTREQMKYALAGSIAEEVLSCIRTVTAFGGQAKEAKRYESALAEGKKLGIEKAVYVGTGLAFTFFIMYGTYALAFWYGSTRIVAGEYTAGTVFTVFFAVMVGSFSLGNAAPHVTTVATSLGSAATVFEILDNIPFIDSYSTRGKKPRTMKGRIVFKDVNFSYPSRSNITVLKNLSLTVEPGQTVALVGSSGSGKSTIVNLLLRFYDAVSGTITIDGERIEQLNVAWLRDNIGVVSQEPVLFGCTIAENIAYGRRDVTVEEMVEAAKMANAHDYIMALPLKYNTVVGERGTQLSGGQKQRVAIARALVRDPKLLLLDEATSALDSESEGVVQAALDKAREGRTTIAIAHRLSTIQNSDCIYAMQDGRVVESGSHEELMSAGSLYSDLVSLQNFTDQAGNKVETEDFERQKSLKYQRSMSVAREKSTRLEEQEFEKSLARPGWMRMIRENSPEWPLLLVGACASVVTGCAMPAFALFYSEIFRVFGETDIVKLEKDALFWSMMFLVLAASQAISYFTTSLTFGTSGERLTMRLRLNVFCNIVRQEIGWFDDEKHSSGKLSTRLATDAPMVKGATGTRLSVVTQALVSVAAGVTIAFIFGWQLALAILASIPILAGASAIQFKHMQGNQKRDAELMENAGKTATEAIENMRTVASLVQEQSFFMQYCGHLEKPFIEAKTQAHVYGFAFAFSQSMVFFMYAGAFRFGAYLVGIGEMDVTDVYRVFFAIAFCAISVGQASSFLPDYAKARLSAALIFRLQDLVPSIDPYSSSGARPAIVGEIALNKVEFRYPTRPDVRVLKGVSLKVNPGQTLALVGSSGCGKSTITNLIERFYDVGSGQVIIDGYDIRKMNVEHLRSQMSVVSQEPVLFDRSIRDNIAYALPTPATDAQVLEAARAANIHEFIAALPKGYATKVGEKGTQLSGGQKQRIAIARALIRNPRILLLDEATSALDTESEKIVQAALDTARRGRTCVVVAHRLSTIQNADVIAVIERGHVTETGTHQQLLAARGTYHRLLNAQRIK